MISVTVTGSTKQLEGFLTRAQKVDIQGILQSCGQIGVNALAANTPVESGLAQHSWSFQVSRRGNNYRIDWLNGDVENGFHVAIALQYGYSTGTGGYVVGRDYINPAMRPIFDEIADRVWKAVTSS